MSTTGRRRVILVVCCLSMFLVGLDISAVNVALPSIGADLGAAPSQLQWVVDSYTLVVASLLILGGTTGDRLGRRRIFHVGVVVFGTGSVLCALSPTPEVLIGARAVQAVGGSMLNPVALSIVTTVFTDPQARARAIGLWGSAFGASLAFGPVVGGALVSGLGWQSIFVLNVPICILAVVLSVRYVPESRAPHGRRTDVVGQLLIFLLLATLTFGIIEGHVLGWASPVIVGCFAIAASSSLIVVWYESRRDEPLVDPRFFASAPFTVAVVCAVIAFAATGGFLFLNTLYLQEVRGLTPLGAGLMLLPMAAASACCAPISGRLVATRGTRMPLLAGGLGLAAGGLLLLAVGPGTALAYLGAAYLVFGIGFGLVNAPITNSAVSGIPRTQAGLAAAMASTGRQVGTALGVAVSGAIAFSGMAGAVADDLAATARPFWVVVTFCGVTVAVLAYSATGAWAERTAARTHDGFESPSGTWTD
ncbi:MFS transporter [Gordonia sp. NPDC058843]|uniref:MFS transporter n=1 Tax=Gordonia sp. NPDC058843 TaxID=3346648 RepID=UPI0036A8754B